MVIPQLGSWDDEEEAVDPKDILRGRCGNTITLPVVLDCVDDTFGYYVGNVQL